MFVFQYNYKLLDLKDIIKIKKIKKIKKLNILDYGCGLGIWNEKELKDKINKIILFDKNKKLIPILKKKYKNKKVVIDFNENTIFKNKINLIIFSSVIQYLNEKKLKKIFVKIANTYKNKKLFIFINDHPTVPRHVEIFIWFFTNWKKLFYSIKLIFDLDYLKTKYFFHNIHSKSYINNNFHIKNLKNSNFTRGKFLLTIKNS